jgi:hypothetical protein
MFKVGSQLFSNAGPEAVRQVAALATRSSSIMKYSRPFPNTVAGAVLAWPHDARSALVNVHALGAKRHAESCGRRQCARGVPIGADRPRLIAVTVSDQHGPKDHARGRDDGNSDDTAR